MFRRCFLRCAPTVDDVHAAFRVLGLPSTATSDVIRSKYRELARLHHPDLSSGDDRKMSVINTAYELIQTHGSLVAEANRQTTTSPTSPQPGGGTYGRFVRRPIKKTKTVADLANGASWTTTSEFDWNVAMNDISEKDLKNPANHPLSHSKFYSMEDDATIYRMIRTGATVAQVGRTLGKPATFIEKRLNNAQFKQRVQMLLKRETTDPQARNRVDPQRQTTVRNATPYWQDMSVEEKSRQYGLYNDDRRSEASMPAWSAAHISSKVGKSYANFERFNRR
jgi:hypothetical protein